MIDTRTTLIGNEDTRTTLMVMIDRRTTLIGNEDTRTTLMVMKTQEQH